MKIDITEKLNFDEDPIIEIKGTELTVNSDAESVLKLLGISTELESDPSKILDALNLLFNKENFKKLMALKLKMPDFMKVLREGMQIAMGVTEEPKTP